MYPNTKSDGTKQTATTDYPDFTPEIFKNRAPEYSGYTKTVGLTDTSTIYGRTPSDYQYVTVNHRGYIFAEQTGEYTFTMPVVDNIGLLWVGTNAYYGWIRTNANIVQTWVAANSGQPKQYKGTLTAGRYYAFRAMYANSGGPGNFKLSITGPDGKVIIDDKTTDSPVIVQFSCDGVSAPKFQDFGAET